MELSLFGGNFHTALVQKQAVNEVMKMGDLTVRYGLALTEQQAFALVQTRSQSLKETGRIEFGGGVIDKIIYEFCDSPYVCMYNYEQTLHDLIEAFYHYKNETLDLISDDELIEYMKKAFDGICQGSMDLLVGRELDGFARSVREGRMADYFKAADPYEQEEDEDEQY